MRIVLVAVVAWVAYELLDAMGYAYVLLPAAIAATLVLAGLRWRATRLRRAREAREAKWSAAVLYPPGRAAAIEELEAALATAAVADRVRLTVLRAELLDAEGRSDDAERALVALGPDTLDAFDGGVVRHARASLALRRGDADGAAALLRPRPPRTGAEALDNRLALLDAVVDCERGARDDAERALETATRIRRTAGQDEALALEARVVRAAALDALGERKDALSVLRSLEPAVVDALATLGSPRVKALAAAVRGTGAGEDRA